MPRRTAYLPKLPGTTDLIYPWPGERRPFFPTLLAVILAGAALGFLILTVRIRLGGPEKIAPRHAAVIVPIDDAQGRVLSLRAQEGGPFPARFQLAQWEGMPLLEAEGLAKKTYRAPELTPTSLELPAGNNEPPTQRLAARGQAFFPKHLPPSLPNLGLPQELARPRIAPVIYPLSGIAQENFPRVLPAFSGTVDSAMESATWRFLVRLNAAGTVVECVSLAKGSEAGTAELERWLREISFSPDSLQPSRWISLGIGFTNTPAP
jgi:hypothetical protein